MRKSVDTPPILDLYVGSLGHPSASIQGRKLKLVSLSDSGQEPMIQATRGAFAFSDEVDREAYERTASTFLSHRESLPNHSWIALIDDHPAGACLVSLRYYYSPAKAYPYIDLIAVDPGCQSSGIGHALLGKAMLSLSQAGHDSVVHAHIRRGNAPSERLFLSHGFLCWMRDDG